MYLLGDGEVPCLVDTPGPGHQVVGELYEVGTEDLARTDRLERLRERDGYRRVELVVERFDTDPAQALQAWAYVKTGDAIAPPTRRLGPLPEYLPGHAARFHWRGAP